MADNQTERIETTEAREQESKQTEPDRRAASKQGGV